MQIFLNCDFKFKPQHWPNTVREKEHLEMVLGLGCYFPTKVGIALKGKKKLEWLNFFLLTAKFVHRFV